VITCGTPRPRSNDVTTHQSTVVTVTNRMLNTTDCYIETRIMKSTTIPAIKNHERIKTQERSIPAVNNLLMFCLCITGGAPSFWVIAPEGNSWGGGGSAGPIISLVP